MKVIKLREEQFGAILYDESKESIEELLSIIGSKNYIVSDGTLYVYKHADRYEFELNSWLVIGNKTGTILNEYDFEMLFIVYEQLKE